MKITSIVPGFGGTFYCGNCLRDSSYIKSLRLAGHEAITLPMYLPISVEKDSETDDGIPVFYGAVNIYLKQNFKVFRHIPAWMERFFNSSWILRYAAKKSGSTRASGLEEMTISMLNGDEGYQSDELEQLVQFLKHHEKPDVVHLSNALLIGLAKRIREELKIPVVCSLQDEDVWIDAMRENYIEKLWDLMSEKAQDIDAFVSVSHYFAGVMKKKMRIPDEKLHVVHVGVNPDSYKVNKPGLDPPVIGYLSRMSRGNGFEILIDAFIQLKMRPDFQNVRLRCSGGKTGDDKKFIKKQLNKLEKRGYMKSVEFLDDFAQEETEGFFRGLSVLSVPVLKGEAFGLYQLESLASGVPLVQPALGAFPEVIEATGGGAIYGPNTHEALANKWAEVLSDKDQLKKYSENGRVAINKEFNSRALTERMIKIYEKICNIKD